jgi:hypothetical protein
MHGKITYANFMNLGVGGTHRRNVLFCANGPKQKRIQYIVSQLLAERTSLMLDLQLVSFVL